MAASGEQIGAWLKAMRERQGKYSQEQVAPLVGTTGRTIYSWEKGIAPPVDKFLGLVALYEAENDIAMLLALGNPGKRAKVTTPDSIAAAQREFERELDRFLAKSKRPGGKDGKRQVG